MKQATIDQAMRLAIQNHQAGRLAEAQKIYEEVLSQQSDYADALHLLGVIAYQCGQADTAIELIQKAIAINPGVADYHNNLGSALRAKGLHDQAIAAHRRALGLKSNFPEAAHNIGNSLLEMGLLDQAIASYRQALGLKPDYIPAHINLALALRDQDLLDEAIATLRQAMSLKVDSAEVHNNLGNVLMDQGEIDQALICYDRAAALLPQNPTFMSNRLYALHFDPNQTPSSILREHLGWNDLHCKPLRSLIKPCSNDRNPERRLRIGYVSPDFRAHPVGRFILPLLASHDRARFEVFCYSCVVRPGDLTARVRSKADVWRDISRATDEQAAELIRRDQIDILVDLAMHSANNRLLIFARKPAPVQVTYLAYASTTGLDTVDYRITDPHLDPPRLSDENYSEKSIYIESYWCYQPPIENLPQTPLPAAKSKFVTFGCLNKFTKISNTTLQTWCELLAAVPNSRLLLHAKAGRHRQRHREFLSNHGINPQRLTFVEKVPLSAYMEQYQQIDIGLDPFPYCGGTTTCDALWMGVPVITLRGQTAVSRAGVSILNTIGLPELIAENTTQYIQIATELSNNLPRLSRLRLPLREQMQNSPLMDAQRFARQMESAYRQMWTLAVAPPPQRQS